jgi:hypothetical protein
VAEVKITFCNRAYADNWYKNLRRHNGFHFTVLQAIITEIVDKNGSNIVKSDIYSRDHEVYRYLSSAQFDIIPNRGQMLKHNGNGIRHAKFAPSKNIAVVWEKIGDTIFVTFDDHAPIRYHRAIKHLRDIKLGKTVFPKRPRNTGRFLKKIKIYWKFKYSRGMYGVNLKHLYYK